MLHWNDDDRDVHDYLKHDNVQDKEDLFPWMFQNHSGNNFFKEVIQVLEHQKWNIYDDIEYVNYEVEGCPFSRYEETALEQEQADKHVDEEGDEHNAEISMGANENKFMYT